MQLNERLVEEVGEEKALAFAKAVQRASARLDRPDHVRALSLVEEEVATTGVRVARAELEALADQIARFDRVEVHDDGSYQAEQPDPLAETREGDRPVR